MTLMISAPERRVRLTLRRIPSLESVRRACGQPDREIALYTVRIDGKPVFTTTDPDAAIGVARGARDGAAS